MRGAVRFVTSLGDFVSLTEEGGTWPGNGVTIRTCRLAALLLLLSGAARGADELERGQLLRVTY